MVVHERAATMRPRTWQLATRHEGLGGVDATPQPMAIALPTPRVTSILVVDDETQIVDFLCMLLEDEGFRALRAHDGAQAWDVIRSGQHPPDLVITDVMMPRMTGLQLVQRLNDSYNGSCPPVIVMSAVTEVRQGAAMRFLPKPFDIERLLDLVDELVGQRGPGGEGVSA